MQKFKDFLNEELLTEAVNVSRLQKMYREFNKKYFKDALPEIEIEFGALKKAFAFVRATQNRSTGEIKIDFMKFNNSLKLSQEQFEKTMIHEMIHVKLFVEGKLKHGHGAEFQMVRRDLERLSGISIPDTDSVSGLDVFDKSKTKKLWVLTLEFGTGKKFAMLAQPKAFENISRTTVKEIDDGILRAKKTEQLTGIKPHPAIFSTTAEDVITDIIRNFAKQHSARSARFGVVNTFLGVKLKVKNNLNKFSAEKISDDDFAHIMRELDKDKDAVEIKL